MQWWIYLLIALGVVAFLIILLLCIRANNSKKVKFKIPKVESEEVTPKQEEPVQKQESKAEPIVEEFSNITFDEPEVNKFGMSSGDLPENASMEEYDPFAFDDVLNEEDEMRYREFMDRHEKKQPRVLSHGDEFAKFRNEHCYSKYVTDSSLLERLTNVPPEARPVILADLFKRINLEDIDSKSL